MVRHRAEEINSIANTDVGGDSLEAVLLALVAILAVFAENQQADVVVVAVTKQSQGANGDLDAFEALEPPHKEQQAARSVTDLAPSLVPVDRLEDGQVHTGRHDKHALGNRSVRPHQLCAFIGRGRNQEIGLLRDLSLNPDAQRRFRSSARGQGPVLDQSKRVRDVRPPAGQVWPQEAGYLTREPVVREQEVIRDAFAFSKIEDLRGEGRHLVVQRVLIQPPSGGQIDHPGQLGQGLDRRVVRRLLAGEDVGRDAPVAEGGGDLVDVDVEAAVRVLTQRSRGRRVYGDDRDPPWGAVRDRAASLSHGTPISRQASVVRRSRNRNGRPASRKA